MACKKRGRACLKKIAKTAHMMGWECIFNYHHKERDESYAVVLVDKEKNAHAFKSRGDALVFVVREARKLGFSN